MAVDHLKNEEYKIFYLLIVSKRCKLALLIKILKFNKLPESLVKQSLGSTNHSKKEITHQVSMVIQEEEETNQNLVFSLKKSKKPNIRMVC